MRAFAAQVLADANAALAGPLTEDQRDNWLGWLRTVELMLALDRELAEVEARMPARHDAVAVHRSNLRIARGLRRL